MAYRGNTGIKRVLLATLYSWQGLKVAFKKEAAFRQESILAIILIPLVFWPGETGGGSNQF